MKRIIPLLLCILVPTLSFSIGPISGPTLVCVGNSGQLSDATTGGTWSSSNTAVASVSVSGLVTGIATGTATISYTVGASYTTLSVIIPPGIGPVTGASSLCYGTTQLFADTTAGGIWSSTNTAVAVIGSSSGYITAVAQGTSTISYTHGGCYALKPVNVSPAPGSLWGCDNIGIGDSLLFIGTAGASLLSSDNTIASWDPANGKVAGISTGSATISLYDPSTGCLTASRVVNVTATTLLQPVTGSTPVCVGGNMLLSDPVPGGTWSSGATTIATVDGTGNVTAISGGTAMISYTYSGAVCTIPALVNSLPPYILAPSVFCVGDTVTLTGATGTYRFGTSFSGIDWYGLGPTPIDGPPDGLTFTSSDPSTAAVVFGCYPCDYAGIKGISGGVAVITYTDVYTTCATTTSVTVNTTPVIPPITGGTGACVTGSVTLADALPGGTWSSSNTSIATVNPSTGFATGLALGTDTISYSATNGCGTSTQSIIFTVSGTPPPVPSGILGQSSVCVGATAILHDTTAGGTWSSSIPSIATINSTTGAVTGVYPGNTPILYTATNSCGSSHTILQVTVDPLPSAIYGTTSICAGSSVTLHDSVAGGTWTSGSVWIANVVPGTGFVTGLASGIATITYSAGMAQCSVTAVVTVNALPSIFAVTGGGGYCSGGTGVHIMLGSSATGVSYQLYRYSTVVGTPMAGTGAPLDFGLQTTAGVYTIKAIDAVTGCSSNMSGSATVTINPLPNLYTITGGGSFCAGGTGFHIYLVGSQSGISYQLYRGTSPVGGPMIGTGIALNFGIFATAGVYTIVATYTATGCSSTMPGTATITVNPAPAPFHLTGGGGYCAGASGVHVGLDSSNIGISYQLYRGLATAGTPVAGINAPLDFGLETLTGSYTVKAFNTATGCSATMPGSDTVFINPAPAAYPVTGGGGYCAGGTGVHITLGDSHTGIRYKLYRDTTFTGILLNGTDTSLDFGLLTTAGTYKVIATDTTTGCTHNMSGTATILINPSPSVYSVTGGGSYCSGGTGVYVGLDGSDIGIHYQLFYAGAPVGIPAIGTGGALVFGSETAAGSYTATATDPTSACAADMAGAKTVSINPSPSMITGIDTLTIGGSTTLSDSITGGTWMASNLNATVDPLSGVVHGDSLGRDTITYTLSTGCAASITVTVYPTVINGVHTISVRGELAVFPNPSSGLLNITWTDQPAEDATVTITDLAGREIMRGNIFIGGSGTAHLDLEAIQEGMYIIAIRSEHIHYDGKLLISR